VTVRVAIRTDASVTIGSGHAIRCATLADALRRQGAEVIFFCRELPGHYCDWLEGRGFLVHRLSGRVGPQHGDSRWLAVPLTYEIDEVGAALAENGPFDWLIVDHYGLSRSWELAMRPHCRKIMVIDDLADRPHDCDLLLDQNLQQTSGRYSGLVPKGCRSLLGPGYALLQSEFAKFRSRIRERNGAVQRILICMGGSDPDNVTGTALRAVQSVGKNLQIDVVIGQANPNRAELERLCSGHAEITLHVQSSEMARLMNEADLMIGAAGGTTWERCCLGLPGIVTCLAENQRETCRQVASKRAAWFLGDAESLSCDDFSRAVEDSLRHPALLRGISRRAARMADGLGADRAALAMLGLTTLVTSASRKVPLLKAVRQAQAKLGAQQDGGRLCVADSDIQCISRHFADAFWHMPPLKELSEEELVAQCRAEGIRFIVPTRDGELPFFARSKDRLREEGIAVMVSSARPVEICLDKLEFARTLRAMGFPVIPAETDPDLVGTDRLVVKERYGAGSCRIALNVTRSEAVAHAVKLQAPIFQPFVPGDEFSIDVYVSRDGECLGAIARRREVVRDGESQITRTVSYPLLESTCARLAERLNLYGHAVFQAIVEESGAIQIIECNPRFGGASTLSVHAGLTSFLWFLCEGSGIDPRVFPFHRSSTELRQIRYPCDEIHEIGQH